MKSSLEINPEEQEKLSMAYPMIQAIFDEAERIGFHREEDETIAIGAIDGLQSEAEIKDFFKQFVGYLEARDNVNEEQSMAKATDALGQVLNRMKSAEQTEKVAMWKKSIDYLE